MARERPSPPDKPAATTFFTKTFDEALDLVVEARDYVRDTDDPVRLLPADRIVYCCERMRLTARLTQIMAWLLQQRALHTGETTIEILRADPDSLRGSDICLAPNPIGIDRLPGYLKSLLDRSENLYRRVVRLNDLLVREVD